MKSSVFPVIFCCVALAAARALCAAAIGGQSPPPTFDVAVVKPYGGQLPSGGCRGADEATTLNPRLSTIGIGTCRLYGYTLKALINIAYGMGFGTNGLGVPSHLDRIPGGPDWTSSQQFAIDAKSDPPAMRAQLLLMLQTLLVQEFKLKFHHESKEVSGYALVVAKDGPKLKDAKPDQLPGFTARITAGRAGQGSIAGRGVIGAVVAILYSELGVQVSDDTGLNGTYELDLKWTSSDTTDASASSGPSIFTALQEQLGLKLEPRKISTDIFVVDHAEQPAG